MAMSKEKLTKIKILVATKSLKETGTEFPSRARTIFNLLKENGIDVREVWTRQAQLRKVPTQIELEEDSSGEGCHKKGWITRI